MGSAGVLSRELTRVGKCRIGQANVSTTVRLLATSFVHTQSTATRPPTPPTLLHPINDFA